MVGRSRAGAGKCPPQQLVCDPFIPHTHTESLFSSAILIPPFLCHNKQPIPNYFFITGPGFATIVLKFVISGATELILAVHRVTGGVTWALPALRV